MTNYDLNVEKRQIQKTLFPLVKKRRIVTLAGPNLISYLKMFPKSVKEIQIWENKPEIMLTQLEQLAKIKHADGRRFDYRYGDILAAKANNKSFYDLDFCDTIKGAWVRLEKFKDCQYSATFCLRAYPLGKTIRDFLLIVGEKEKIHIPHRQFNLMKTDKSDYLYTTYKDNTPMVTIFKLN